jgi:hypothetical protein
MVAISSLVVVSSIVVLPSAPVGAAAGTPGGFHGMISVSSVIGETNAGGFGFAGAAGNKIFNFLNIHLKDTYQMQFPRNTKFG